MPLTASKLLRLNVSKDGLTATVTVNGPDPVPMTVADIEREIAALTVVIDEEGHKEIARFASELENGIMPQPAVVARGTPPVHDRSGRVEKLFEKTQQEPAPQEEQPPADNEPKRASHYDRSSIIAVRTDQPLLKLLPPVIGRDGIDVYGKPIARKIGREVTMQPGLNVYQEGDIIYAKRSGKLELEPEKVWINPKLEIATDVDFSTGNIDFGGDVVIAKNVLDLFKVVAEGNISIIGIAEAAEVRAGKHLKIKGGIAGKEKGKFYSGEDLISKYITNASAEVGANCQVQTEIVNSDILCKGQVLIPQGLLVGGRVGALAGMTVKQLGSEAGTKTLVEIGIDLDMRQRCLEIAPEVQKRRVQARKVRQVVEPLLANQKQLNSEQAEKATELLFQAQELEDEVEAMLNELRPFYEAIKDLEPPKVQVLKSLHSGVTIRFLQVETIITEPLKGPIKIYPKKVRGTYRVFAVSENGGAETQLRTSSNSDNFWATLEQLLNPPEQQ